jgi:hypothetical protein
MDSNSNLNQKMDNENINVKNKNKVISKLDSIRHMLTDRSNKKNKGLRKNLALIQKKFRHIM